MDDFRVSSALPYDRAYQDQQRTGDSNRKKAKPPKSENPEDEVSLGESTASESETGDSLGVEDYYSPSDRTDEPK
jgi:hypothetical protein